MCHGLTSGRAYELLKRASGGTLRDSRRSPDNACQLADWVVIRRHWSYLRPATEEFQVAGYSLKDRYTKDEAKKARTAVERKVRNGSLEVMQGAAYKAHITKRTGRH